MCFRKILYNSRVGNYYVTNNIAKCTFNRFKKREFKSPLENSEFRPDYSKDDNLTDFGKATLIDRYLLPGEKFQDMFLRVAKSYSDDLEHAKRIYGYISKLWFMPATPVFQMVKVKRSADIMFFEHCS